MVYLWGLKEVTAWDFVIKLCQMNTLFLIEFLNIGLELR